MQEVIDGVIKLTQALIRIPSHKYEKNRESNVSEYIYNYCKSKGLDAEMQEVEGLRRNVIVRLKGNGTGKTLLLNGHIDTVPPYEMTIEPFSGDLIDGFIYGRGANDMKGAVACMITAMLNIKNKGKILGGDIILTAVVGEEEKSDGTEFVVKSGIKAGVLSTYGKIPTVVTGPGDLKYSHTKDEKIPVKDLLNYVEIYTKIAEKFCE